jgi:hypothetical protein
MRFIEARYGHVGAEGINGVGGTSSLMHQANAIPRNAKEADEIVGEIDACFSLFMKALGGIQLPSPQPIPLEPGQQFVQPQIKTVAGPRDHPHEAVFLWHLTDTDTRLSHRPLVEVERMFLARTCYVSY